MKNKIILLQFFFFSLGQVSSPAISWFTEEIIVEARFRGNFTTSDEEMIRLAKIEIGVPVDAVSFENIRQRLLKTGRFERVEVSKRYRSLSSSEKVILLVTVREKQSAMSKFMFMPMLKLNDEYGFTYGLRTTAKNLLGFKERLSIPLTWRGVRRAALESEFEVHNPIFNTLTLAVDVTRKENPYYRTSDFRRGVQVGLRRRLKRFEVRVHSGWTGIDFGSQNSSFVTFGTSFIFDTRQDVNLPRDAFYTGIAWERLQILNGGQGFNRYTLDLRGYKGVIGQMVLAGQFLHRTVDGRLPDFERPFLGGANTLRGYKPGAFIGDNIVTSSIEMRMPLTSPRAVYHAGINVFLDSGAVYDYGTSIGNTDFKYGTGIGCFFLFMGFGIKADIAYDMHDDVRVHFSTGFRF
jgi:outer membrane protein assembly factor BamA